MRNENSSDLTGKKFGRWTAISKIKKYKSKYTAYLCRCECGNEGIVLAQNLKNGSSKSCGCLHRELSKKKFEEYNLKHGLATSSLYSVWKNIRQRCSNPNNSHYKSYGGRGITICEEWNDFGKFYEWCMINGYQKGLTIERIDNNKGYSPDNCTFITPLMQHRNKQRTVFLEYNGERKSLIEWCEIYGLRLKTCYGRMHNYHWTNPKEILFGKGA